MAYLNHHTIQPTKVINTRLALAETVPDNIFLPLYSRADYLTDAELTRLYKAFIYAYHAHDGQKRNSGEPYITHPVAVACICANWKLDICTLQAALLHDVVEDCATVSYADIKNIFGVVVAEIVDGVTKLEKIKFTSREENMAESFRKMLLAMAKDVRVILIKLADRTHNMRTLGASPCTKWGRIANETMDIYVPLAYRLGINATYRELRYLAFKYSMPWRFNVIEKAVNSALARHLNLINQVLDEVKVAFKNINIDVRIERKEKELYSVYRNMKDKGLSFAQVNDLCGFLIVVPKVMDCYSGLGLLHQKYKPILGKFKDHIAIPKVNGYQALHTTLMLSKSIAADFQIQTENMHTVAESGIITNWLTRISRPISEKVEQMDTKWLQSLIDIQKENDNAGEFWEFIKGDLFPDSVYVFTPKGRIFALPADSTPIDFAYAVHTDIGDKTIATKINNEQKPLRTKLQNGDTVEIITSSVSNPNPDWLSFVKTGRARSKIKNFIRNMQKRDAFDLGQKLLLKSIKAEGFSELPDYSDPIFANNLTELLQLTNCTSIEELIGGVGTGKFIAVIIAKNMAKALINVGKKPDTLLLSTQRFENTQQMIDSALILDGVQDNFLHYATCCYPIPGDSIIAILSQGGLTVHRTKCPKFANKISSKQEQVIEVVWSEDLVRKFAAAINISLNNVQGILASVINLINQEKIDIKDFSTTTSEKSHETANLNVVVLIQNRQQLEHLIKRISVIHQVTSVKRL